MKVLLVSAHADDAETSCGGTVARLKRESEENDIFGGEDEENVVWSIYFCDCPIKDHLEQHREVCKYLGIDRLIEYRYHGDVLEEYKQEIRDILFKLREEYKPDIVFCPSSSDMHQDHKVIAECCLTIFRDTSTILGYEVLRSVGAEFKSNFYIILTDMDAVKKLITLSLYKAQIKRNFWFSYEAFKAQLVMRGVEAKTLFAEAFELIRGRIK